MRYPTEIKMKISYCFECFKKQKITALLLEFLDNS